MRKVTYGAASSFDGCIAGPGEEIDWLRWNDDASKISAESWKGVDTILVGRKTWEWAQKMGGGPGGMGKMKSYLFSRTMTEAPQGVELVQGDAVEFVRELKAQAGGDIIVLGGGELGSALVEGGVVDEIGFNIHPILLGSGIPMFREMARRVELELIEARPIADGCVLVRYRVGGTVPKR